jgi:enoyl-CoA hydratase/carnithine racemase
MNYRFLQIEDAGVAQIITLHRPDRRNALSASMLSELEAATTTITAGSLIIASTGPVFSSGHDLNELIGADQSECTALFDCCARVMMRFQQLPIPVIAEVQGLATAAGLQLVAACDLGIASEDASFATPGVRIGLFCSTPMIPLVRAVGRKRAFEMLMTAEPIHARTALEWGLINRVVPREALRATTLALAQQIARSSPAAIAFGKKAFYDTCGMADAEAYAVAARTMVANAQHPDSREGVSAFLGKRPPIWVASPPVHDR